MQSSYYTYIYSWIENVSKDEVDQVMNVTSTLLDGNNVMFFTDLA